MIDIYKWVVTSEKGSVISAYFVGPGAEETARQEFDRLSLGRAGVQLWRVTETWEQVTTQQPATHP